MTELEAALRAIGAELDDLGVAWALVGGLAVGSRAEPRTTRDVDLAVAVEGDRAAEKLVADLGARGYVLRALVEHEGLGRLATARLRSPSRGMAVTIDLLFASSGIEAAICSRAERLEIVAGLMVPVATTGDLIALKLLARDDRSRPQDLDDLRALLRYGGAKERELAERAALEIQAVGASRRRDLVGALADLVRALETD